MSELAQPSAEAAASASLTDVGVGEGFEPWPDAQVHIEWSPVGARLAAERGDVVVVVDVLSFSTTLSIATDRDFTCLVYSGAEISEFGGPAEAGRILNARPLSKRRQVLPGQISLSPHSLLSAEPGQRVLFTSLNGAAAAAAAASAPALLVGGLRNATATAAEITRLLRGGTARRVTIVACGEQWSSVQAGTAVGLRPSLEDWSGAGLIASHLAAAGFELSAEALGASRSWAGPEALAACVSARELVEAGFSDDVNLALEVDVSPTAVMRIEGEHTGRAFRASSHHGDRGVRSDFPGWSV